MASNNNAVLYLVIGMVIIGLLVTPSLFSAGSELLDRLTDFVQEGFGGLGASGSDSRVNLLVHYADGTEKLFDSAGLPILAIHDPDSNKIVEWVKPIVKVTVEKSGTTVSWSLSGTLKIRLSQRGGTTTIYTWSHPFTTEGSAWTNLEAKTVYQHQLPADAIEQKIIEAGVYQDNDNFVLSFVGTLETLTMTFKDGTTEQWTTSKTYKTTWTCVWLASDLKSVSVSVNFEKG
jgi:hypothetical protein